MPASSFQQGLRDSNNRGGGDFKYTRKISFRPNETKKLRFVGPVEEPHMVNFHSLKSVKNGVEKFDTLVCGTQFQEKNPSLAEGKEGELRHWVENAHPGCVFCFYKKNNKADKRLSGASVRAVLTVLDMSLMHQIPNAKGTADSEGWVYVNETACTGPKCAFCRSTAMARMKDGSLVPIRDKSHSDIQRWEMAMKGGQALWNQILFIRDYCSCCWPSGSMEGQGFVETVSLSCAGCGEGIHPDSYSFEEEVRHSCACGHYAQPDEVVACANGCENARRTQMFDGEWSVTRSGEGVNTSFGFTFRGVSDPPDWFFDLEVPDLTKEIRPMSAAKMADKLQIENPFEGRQVSASQGFIHPQGNRGATPQGGNAFRRPSVPQQRFQPQHPDGGDDYPLDDTDIPY